MMKKKEFYAMENYRSETTGYQKESTREPNNPNFKSASSQHNTDKIQSMDCRVKQIRPSGFQVLRGHYHPHKSNDSMQGGLILPGKQHSDSLYAVRNMGHGSGSTAAVGEADAWQSSAGSS